MGNSVAAGTANIDDSNEAQKRGKVGYAPDGEEPLHKVMPPFQLLPIPSQLVLQFLAICSSRPRRLPILVELEVGVEGRVVGWVEERVMQEEIKDVPRQREGDFAAADLGKHLLLLGRDRLPSHFDRARLDTRAQERGACEARSTREKKRSDGGRKKRAMRDSNSATETSFVLRFRGCLIV